MKTNTSIDEDLVNAYKAGDKTALTALVKRWHKKFCDKAYWMVKDKDAAKDIAQESWTIIIHKIEHLKKPSQFKYWAYRIVCNKSTDWLRIQSKNQKRTVNHKIEIENNEEKYSENTDLKSIMSKAINNLPEHQKTVLKLFYIQEYSLKQISEILKISVGTAKSRLFHAREKLKKELRDKYE